VQKYRFIRYASGFFVKKIEYKNHQVYLGLASMAFDEDIEKKCKEIFKQSGYPDRGKQYHVRLIRSSSSFILFINSLKVSEFP